VARRVAPGTVTLLLDAEGLSKAAKDDVLAGAWLKKALQEQARVVVCAVTLAEVLRGGPRDASVHRVLGKVNVVPVNEALGRAAGELLGRAGGSDTVDALVAATASGLPGEVLVLTSDQADLGRLTEGNARVRIHHV
jgi:predicted nucleic acid-binding protein